MKGVSHATLFNLRRNFWLWTRKEYAFYHFRKIRVLLHQDLEMLYLWISIFQVEIKLGVYLILIRLATITLEKCLEQKEATSVKLGISQITSNVYFVSINFWKILRLDQIMTLNPDNDVSLKSNKNQKVNICYAAIHVPTHRPKNPDAHKNYCRNPDRDTEGLWCYRNFTDLS